jgi:hypothetical protein
MKLKFLQVALVALGLVLGLNACSPQKGVAYLAGAERSKFVGNWTLSNVSYQYLIANAVQRVFEQAPPAAFTNSKWVLTNSGNGSYTLADGTAQRIFWSYQNAGSGANPIFQFKKLFDGDKAKEVQSGYQLVATSNDGNTMVLKMPVDMGSKLGYVVFTFSKN